MKLAKRQLPRRLSPCRRSTALFVKLCVPAAVRRCDGPRCCYSALVLLMPGLRGCIVCVSRVAAYIAAYCVCAVVGGRMLCLWWRMGVHGRFCVLMVCGRCFGDVTWAAKMMDRVNFSNGQDAASRRDRVQQWSLFALSYSWSAVFLVMYVQLSSFSGALRGSLCWTECLNRRGEGRGHEEAEGCRRTRGDGGC
jgi:hypothetical protein